MLLLDTWDHPRWSIFLLSLYVTPSPNLKCHFLLGVHLLPKANPCSNFSRHCPEATGTCFGHNPRLEVPGSLHVPWVKEEEEEFTSDWREQDYESLLLHLTLGNSQHDLFSRVLWNGAEAIFYRTQPTLAFSPTPLPQHH